MDPKLKDILTKSMEALGRATEAVIGRAKKAKGSVATSRGIEPILALESQLPIIKLKELILIGSERIVKPLIPNLIDKSGLEINEGQMRLVPYMKEKGASIAVHVDIGGTAGSYPKDSKTKGLYSIRAESKNVPFEDGFFDFAVANFATSFQGDITRAIKETGRAMTLGGHAVIIDFHPFGRFAKRGGVRLRGMESELRGVEDYYKLCKASGLVVDYVREAFIDETFRAFFVTDEEKAAFRAIKNTPFLIFLSVSKKE